MVAAFDNLEDVNGKFAGTICYYDKKAVMVKAASPHPIKLGEFTLNVSVMGGRGRIIDLNDPAFNYKNYNLGYANVQAHAPWLFRRPVRQYRQGLKRDQIGWQVSDPAIMNMIEENFNFSKPYVAMLENVYPNLDTCQELLVDQKARVIGFHRDFALAWDNLHRDYILEYRGKRVGVSMNNKLSQFRLIDEFSHLEESLREALP